MALELIYGRSGTGKSEYIFNEIKNILNKEKVFIITPEQFSFSAEKKLLDTLGTNSVINAEVLSFNRMASRVLKEVGQANQPYLTKYGKAMLMYDILKRNNKRFKFLTKPEANIKIGINTITELKKHNVSINQMENIHTDDMYLKTKLNDVCLLYKSYQETIKDKCIDENDILTLLVKNIEQSKYFKNSVIFVDEFIGFTPQEYEIIKKLLNIAKKVIVTIPAEVNLDTNLDDIHIDDIFYESKKTASKLIKCAKESHTEIIKPVIFTETHRFKNSELKHLEQNMYKKIYIKHADETENIFMFLAKNRYSEVEFVAKKIVELVKSGKYQYRDISIITKDISTYSSITKVIFSKYNIPIFIDEKKELNQNSLAKYILSIFELLNKNWSYESIFNYLKNSFAGIDIDIVNRLENYCIKWGIKNNKWLNEWKHEDIRTSELEVIRKDIVNKILELQENINCSKSFNNITKCIYEFLKRENIEQKINKKVDILNQMKELELANEYSSSYETIVSVLDEIVSMFGTKETTIDKYKEILKIGLDNIDIGEIPARLDQVIMGDVERSKTHKVKVVYIIGLNDGVFPSSNRSEGFLNDNDRAFLKNTGIELASGTLELLYEEQLNIYKAFTTAEETLFFSYSSSDNEGKSLRPSILISKIKKIFPYIHTESDIITPIKDISVQQSTFDDMLLNLRKAQDGEQIDSIWYCVYNWYRRNSDWKDKLDNAIKGLDYSNLAEEISEDNIKRLYGDTLHTTVSRLEQYRKCPFSFHLKYGLGLEEKQELQLKPIDTGSFMHNIIEKFFTKAEDIKKMSELQIRFLVNEIIEEELQLPKNYIFTSTAKFKLLTNRLKKVIFESISHIVEQLKNSDFNILGSEIEFKEDSKYKPIKIVLDNGKKVEITGKIDRIDLATTGEKRYIRIIDYKSSIKDIDLNEVVNGLQIQLITYLDSINEIEEVEPAGVLYFNLIEPIIKNNKGLTDDEIRQKIKEQFKMRGLILADIHVIKMMDNKLQEGSSDIIPVSIKKDGEISQSSGSAIKKEDFTNLQKQVKRVISQLSKEILKGNIAIKPYKSKKEACEYCSYKSICAFNTSMKGNEYFKIKPLKKEELLYNLKNEK